MKAFRTFKRRKSDRIDALRLHVIGNNLRATLQPIIASFQKASDEYLDQAGKKDESGSQDYLDQLQIFRQQGDVIKTRIAQALDAWFNWKEGERPSLAQIEEQKRQSSEAEWSLMEDHSLEKSLAIERFSGRVIRASNHQWDLFYQRMWVLAADSGLKEQDCPFNPIRLGTLVFDAIDATDMNFKTKSLVYRIFDDSAAISVGNFFVQQNRWLVEEGILPNLQVETVHKGRPAKADINVVRSITQSIAGQTGDAVQIDPAVLNNLIASVSVLQNQNSHIPDASDLGAVKAWANQQASTVTQQFKGSDKSGIISLVSMLFEYFFEDGQLAPLMKHLLARMQIVIIKVAILDNSFFDNSLHPARVLVNKMARAASGWQPNDALENDELYQGMEGIVFRLNDEFEDDIGIFEEMLVVFDELKRKYEAARERALEETRLAEERALAEIESQDRAQLFLTQILDEVQLSENVAKMLKHDWYRLMRLILLKQGESQNWRNSARIAKELVWSLQPGIPINAEERFQLIVPKMLNGLEDGLRAIGKSDEFIVKLLVAIAQQHEKNKQEAELEKLNEAFDQDIARMEAQMRDADQLIAGPIPLVVDEPEVPVVPADINFYLAMTEQLRESMWFDFYKTDENAERLSLSLIVAEGAKYVFTNAQGRKAIERSGLGVAMALRDNKLVQLDHDELVERTLKTVAEKVAETSHL